MKKKIPLKNGSSVDYYPGTDQKFMLYLHGGGLVYGSKNDLPKELVQFFLNKGYSILALDYLLAPNNNLREIIDQLEESVQLTISEMIGNHPFGICGRSAGGFLMLQLTKRLIKKDLSPNLLVNFYGYTDLTFINNERKLIDQQISWQQIEALDLETPTWDDPLFKRFFLYHYAVQHQKLADFYGITALDDFDLTDEELTAFPKTFSSASTTDSEIPFHYSKKIGRLIPHSRFCPVYYLEHDFLKDTHTPEVKVILQKLENWLD